MTTCSTCSCSVIFYSGGGWVLLWCSTMKFSSIICNMVFCFGVRNFVGFLICFGTLYEAQLHLSCSKCLYVRHISNTSFQTLHHHYQRRGPCIAKSKKYVGCATAYHTHPKSHFGKPLYSAATIVHRHSQIACPVKHRL